MTAARKAPSSKPPQTPTFLTARGHQSREALIESARKIFSRDGFLHARIADIASEAGMAYGSFYTYFPSKESIFEEVIKAVQLDMLRAPVEGDGSPKLSERIRRANRQYVAAYRQHAALMATLEQVATFNDDLKQLRKNIRNPYIERNSRAIMRWQAKGLVDPDLDAWYAANALGVMVDRFVYTWMVLGEDFEETLVVETLTRLWINALGMRPTTNRESDQRPPSKRVSAGRRRSSERNGDPDL